MSELYVDDWEGEIDGGGAWLKVTDLGPGAEKNEKVGRWFHFIIDDVKDDGGEREQRSNDKGEYNVASPVELSLRVLAPAELEDARNTLRLNRTGGFAKRTSKFLRMMGLVTDQMIKDAREAGRASITINWDSLIGRTFCGKVHARPYDVKDDRGNVIERKHSCEIQWDFCLEEEASKKGHPVKEGFVVGEDDDPFSRPAPSAAASIPDDLA